MSPIATDTGSVSMASPSSSTVPMAWFSPDALAVSSRTVTTHGGVIPARTSSWPVSFPPVDAMTRLLINRILFLTFFLLLFRHSHQCRTLRLEVRYLRTRIILHPLLDLLELDGHRTVLYRRSALQRREARLRLARGR